MAPGIVYTTRKDLASAEPSGLPPPRRISTAGLAGSLSPQMEIEGSVNVSSTPSPAWWAARSLIVAGTGGEGGTGSPGGPHPAAITIGEKGKWEKVKNGAERFSALLLVPFLFSIFQFLE